MTRIISGVAGSLRLKGPAKATRPTSDRVKESIFAKLESMGAIEGARVLDLFAGTGALGLEAASRGATQVTLVEKDPAAAAVCAENLRLIQDSLQKQGVACGIKLEKLDANKFVSRGNERFDLVFIDPPYEMTDLHLNQLLELLEASLAGGGLVVIERDSRSAEPNPEGGFTLESNKSYGDTAVYLFTR